MKSAHIRWSRVLIVAAGVFGILLICCIGVWTLAPNLRRILAAPFWRTDSALAAQAAHRLIDYDLPPNYQETTVLRIGDSDMAVVISHRERPGDYIHLAELPQGILGVEAWRTQYENNLSKEMGNQRYNTRAVATYQTTIRDQPTTLRVFEGSDEAGRKVRQVVCAFRAKSGDMLLAIVAGQDTWDQSLVDNFVQSIR